MRDNKKTALEYATSLASSLKREVTEHQVPDVGLILGTGWGDCLQLENERSRPFSHLGSHFASLGEIEGHRRVVSYGMIDGKRVIALRGRIHLNEHPSNPELPMHVRLQVQMLLELGVRTFILTNAAGSLKDNVRVGDIVVADGFVTLFAPPMPLFAGEFCSPEDVLDRRLQIEALESGGGLACHNGGYAMMRGPMFEGRRYDKKVLRTTGAACVGMSTVPEASIISLYRGAKALALSFITNDDAEEHSHETNVARAKEKSELLGSYLATIIHRLS